MFAASQKQVNHKKKNVSLSVRPSTGTGSSSNINDSGNEQQHQAAIGECNCCFAAAFQAASRSIIFKTLRDTPAPGKQNKKQHKTEKKRPQNQHQATITAATATAAAAAALQQPLQLVISLNLNGKAMNAVRFSLGLNITHYAIRAKYSEIRFAKKSVVSVPDSAKIKIKGEWPESSMLFHLAAMHKGKGMLSVSVLLLANVTLTMECYKYSFY